MNEYAKNTEQDSPTEDYDPHLHRQLPRPTNNLETLVHLLKCCLGTGILAMPQAFANSGLVTGVVATVVLGVVVTHCLHVLIAAQYAVCKRRRVPLVTYPEAMTGALEVGPKSLHCVARPAAVAVDVFLVVYQLGICCCYIVFIAGNLKKLVDPQISLSIEVHMLIILAPLVAFNMIPNLKVLAPFSALANVLTFIGLGIIIYYLVGGRRTDVLDEKLDLWGTITRFPLFFGTVLFALTSVGVVVSLENNMKTPRAFGTPCGVLNIGMSVIVLLYVAIGALGYIYCVSKCKDTITLDLPQGPAATAVIVMIMIAIFISYGLQCYVPVEVLWRGYVAPRLVRKNASPRAMVLAEYALRIVLCLLTFMLAAAVPRLGLFISLFGALCLSALGICFPALMSACVAYADKLKPRRLVIIKNCALFVVGLVGLVAGTYTALLGIVLSFS